MGPWSKLGIVAVITLAMGGIAAGTWIWILGGPERHADGAGPLASFGRTGTSVSHGFDPKNGPDLTVGVDLCLEPGNAPAVLDGPVHPIATTGDGLVFLGARARQIVPGTTPDHLYGGGDLRGYPPVLSPPAEDAKGFKVTALCDFATFDPTRLVAELDVGVAARPGGLGGGWEGMDIGYTSGGHHHILSAGWGVYACGLAMPVTQCPDPMPHAVS